MQNPIKKLRISLKANEANKLKAERGFTIIETLIYASLVSIVAGVLTVSVANNLKAYNKSEARQNVLANANAALKLIMDEVKYAKSIYTPTSVFGSANGQLSLETVQNAPTGENTTYVDYYLDGGRIYEKREGQAALPLTSDRVFTTSLLFTRSVATSTKDSITVEIGAKINTASGLLESQASTTVQSTAALRGAY
ncbi:hypothetical protein A2988_03210 [Candidatus Azambacteria bacterium RIFCSPLOWO2_01_FULL_46_25]|uniref:Uncharacterized protein n=1 Tax=Candidatus Azambacteria bacterium RIFCSPLOWO2_01_FULL_46_25 TaxID=1797298 RepID=A0A1F5BV87_9BACT|nr:MAG: hypothetical protein A2988_03210 [Candidatus Azambacteria bacterium RIFCSPLOWO2_01_FULL_46_25]OGD38014.1 MAG: hypothetical protein A2850_02890 [Candidatus Azambacteria bacterium RIFCSPHIGHO2_01_FULL_51_74]